MCSTARGATTRRIGEATALEKFLFASREGEFLITVAAIQDTIGKFHSAFSIPRLEAWCILLYCAASNRHPTRSNDTLYSIANYSTFRLPKAYVLLSEADFSHAGLLKSPSEPASRGSSCFEITRRSGFQPPFICFLWYTIFVLRTVS